MAGPSTPNRSPADLSLHPKSDSSASGAVCRPCSAVFGVPWERKGGLKGLSSRFITVQVARKAGLRGSAVRESFSGPMDVARRQGLTRRGRQERRISAGLSTPDKLRPASKGGFERFGRCVSARSVVLRGAVGQGKGRLKSLSPGAGANASRKSGRSADRTGSARRTREKLPATR